MAYAVRIHELGKRFVLRAKPARTLGEAVAARLRFALAGRRFARREFWALRDVTVDVDEGEVVGVVGRNGAGKSTLLRILAGITDPTEGYAEVRGRVGALLDVGTGFHPELSGRDNIYLNGAILGMRRSEIDRRYDEIIEFAEINAFLDVPVKRYSSGMYVRLAFAVAAHLDPEILLVDEVLSVGDQAFQEKCLGRIHEVTRSGRTVLFVSHNLASLLRLCERGVLLEKGRLTFEGPMAEAVERYLSSRPQLHEAGDLTDVQREGNGELRFRSIEVIGPDGTPTVYAGGPAELKATFGAVKPVPGRQLKISFGINSQFGDRLVTLVTSWDPDNGVREGEVTDGTTVSCLLPDLPLRPGKYLLTLYVDRAGELLDNVDGQIEFEIAPSDYFGTGELPSESQGPLLVRQSWALEQPATVSTRTRTAP
jgi:lipopolysaccharide transport system ATP-binding protein